MKKTRHRIGSAPLLLLAQVQALTSQLRLHPNSRVDKASAEFWVAFWSLPELCWAPGCSAGCLCQKLAPQLPRALALRVVVASLPNEA